jgi:predicted dehydrogenase
VARSEYESVFAQTAHRSGRDHEDLVAFTGRLLSGVVTNHLVNWLSPLKERVTIMTGERGTLIADTLTADLTLYENGKVASEWGAIASFRGVSEGDVTRFAIPKPEPLRTEHEAFRDAILGLDADIVTLEQGVQTLAVAEAVLESARTGTSIDVA